MTTTFDLDGRLLREVQLMSAAGWQLYRREQDGAVFTAGSAGSGVSTGAHLLLLVLTLGLWLPLMIVVELASMGRVRFCRLTFDPWGDPRYEPIKRPR